MPDHQITNPTPDKPRLAFTDNVFVPAPSDEARATVRTVLHRALSDQDADAYERKVFTTPGVLEALDEALAEVEALKRSM